MGDKSMNHRIYDNGIYRDMTPEEIAALEAQASDTPAPTPTIEERVGKVEESVEAVRIILMGDDGEE